jgi:hypothetical protein
MTPRLLRRELLECGDTSPRTGNAFEPQHGGAGFLAKWRPSKNGTMARAGFALGSKFQWRLALRDGDGSRMVTELSGDLKKRHSALKVRCRQAEAYPTEELK